VKIIAGDGCPSSLGSGEKSVVFGALRPPRVVFVIGCVSCNKFSHFRQKGAGGEIYLISDLA
jgi:hypothetical protein